MWRGNLEPRGIAGFRPRLALACTAVLFASFAAAPAPVEAAPARPAAVKPVPPKNPHADRKIHRAIKSQFLKRDPRAFAQPKAAALPAGQAAAAAGVGGAWTFQGPEPIAGEYNESSGRVTTLAIDPSDVTHSTVYAGTAGGGVWKTIDSGQHWVPLTDGQAVLSIGAVAVDPNHPQTVYAGTGEPNNCIDCYTGDGVLKSTDGGITWTLYGGAQLAGHRITAIVVDRTNSQRVLVASSVGLFVSTDGGQTYALNNSLFNLTNPALPNGDQPMVDALIQDPDPAHASNWYAAVDERCDASGFIGMSTDGGSTWKTSIRASNVAGTPDVIRFGLGEGPNGVLYAALAACSSTTPSFADGQLVAVWKSTNYATAGSWSKVNVPTDYFNDGPGFYQGWYDNMIAVDPTNANHAVFGGVTLLATKDGGNTFTDVALPYATPPGPVHPDFHAAQFFGPDSLYAGNDGGVWSTTDLGGTAQPADWNNLNATFAITTFYGGDASDVTHMIGGAQDGGTTGITGASSLAWPLLQPGDGVHTYVRGYKSTTFFGELPYATIFVEDWNNPSTAQLAAPCAISSDPACNDPTWPLVGFELDPNPSYSWIYTGTNKVYRSQGGLPAGAQGWGAITGDLTTGKTILAGGDAITTMAISPSGDSLAVGTLAGKLWRIDGLHGSYTVTDLTSSIPSFSFNNFTGVPWVSGLSFSSCVLTVPPVNNACDLTVTLGAVGVPRVWYVPYSGAAVNVTANLDTVAPNTVVNDIYATTTGDGVYIGTVAGAYVCFTCPTGSPSWSPLGSGLPNSPIDQIGVTHDGNYITAWTHGRGEWTMPRTANLSASTNALNFPTTSAGDTNTLQFTVSNSGLLNENATGNITGTNGADFKVIFGCSPNGTWAMGRIAPQSTCNVSVQFTPSIAGPETATLTITGNSVGGNIPITLTGTGQRPNVSLSANSLTFPATPVQNPGPSQTLTITNQGPGNYHLYTNFAFTGPNGNSFSYAGGTCLGATVTPGNSCTFMVGFNPQTGGSLSAILTLTDNSVPRGQTVQLSGTGTYIAITYSPTSLMFAAQDAGTRSAQQMVTFTNKDSSATLYLGQLTITGANPSDFYVSSTCSAIAPGQSCSFGVLFQPAPNGGSARSATLNVYDNGGGTPQQVALSGTALVPAASISPNPVAFGNQSVNFTSPPQTVTVTNTGSGHLTISRMTFNTNDYSVVPGSDQCTNVLVAAGASCTFQLQYNPQMSGTDNGTLQLWDNTVAGVETVQMTGTGAAPTISANGPPYGTVPVGQSSTQTMTITNGGPGSMLISRMAFSGGNVNDFSFLNSIDHCTGQTVAAGASCTTTITFTPSAVGYEQTTVLIYANTGTQPGYVPILINGTGGAALISVPGSVGYGLQPITSARTMTIQPYNTGNMNLNVTGIFITGANAGDFVITSESCTSAAVAPGGFCTINVAFGPSTLGGKTATLTVSSNAQNGSQATALSGNGDIQSLGGILTTAPTASSWGAHESDVFVVGSDNALWYRHLTGTTWSGWQRLGGVLTAKPASVSYGPNRIDVFVRGTDNGLWWMYWNGSAWSGWQSLGGVLTSAPAVESRAPGTLDVFVRGTDNGLWYRSWNGSAWTAWQSLGGVITADPAVTSSASGRIDVTVRGTDNGLWYRYFDSTGWHPWQSLGGVLTDGPSASSCTSGEVDVYVLGTGGGFWRQIFSNGAWSGWQYGVGTWTSAPAASCETGSGVTDVYLRGTDQGLWHLAF